MSKFLYDRMMVCRCGRHIEIEAIARSKRDRILAAFDGYYASLRACACGVRFVMVLDCKTLSAHGWN